VETEAETSLATLEEEFNHSLSSAEIRIIGRLISAYTYTYTYIRIHIIYIYICIYVFICIYIQYIYMYVCILHIHTVYTFMDVYSPRNRKPIPKIYTQTLKPPSTETNEGT